MKCGTCGKETLKEDPECIRLGCEQPIWACINPKCRKYRESTAKAIEKERLRDEPEGVDEVTSGAANLRPCAVTAFSPTPTGPLHVGHLIVAASSHREAKAMGGKFILSLDDVALLSKGHGTGEMPWPDYDVPVYGPWRSVREYEREFVEDLTWAGVAPDEVHYASEFSAAHDEWSGRLGVNRPVWRQDNSPWGYTPRSRSFKTRPPDNNCTGMEGFGHLEFCPWFVLGWAVEDCALGVTDAIWGADLWPMSSLYAWFSLVISGRQVRMHPQHLVRGPGCPYKMSGSDPKGTKAILLRDLREAGFDAKRVLTDLMYLRYRSYCDNVLTLDIPADWLSVELGPDGSRRWEMGLR